eukprot:scaffold1628_cov407-Prasinococcus_capsulatus_cf.AAC.5
MYPPGRSVEIDGGPRTLTHAAPLAPSARACGGVRRPGHSSILSHRGRVAHHRAGAGRATPPPGSACRATHSAWCATLVGPPGAQSSARRRAWRRVAALAAAQLPGR